MQKFQSFIFILFTLNHVNAWSSKEECFVCPLNDFLGLMSPVINPPKTTRFINKTLLILIKHAFVIQGR